MEALDFVSDSEDRKLLEQAIEKQGELLALQLLSDLGYVPFEHFRQKKELGPIVRKRAIRLFRKEYKALLETESDPGFEAIYHEALTFDHEERDDQLSEREEFLLSQVTGLESELSLSTIPLNQTSLLSRVFFYRFRIYDITSLLASNTYSEDIANEFRSVLSGIDYHGSSTDFANLLADQKELSNFILSSERLRPELYKSTIFFSVKRDAGRDILNEFTRRLLRNDDAFLSVIDNEPEQKEVKELIRPGKIDEVNLCIQGRENQFLLRVLQVKLWILGLYEGHLDTDFGSKTFKALKELLEHLDDNSESEKEISKLLHSIRKQHWAFNMEYFLKVHLGPLENTEVDSEEGTSISRVYEFIMNEDHPVSALSESDQQLAKKGVTAVTDSLEEGVKNHAEKIVNVELKKRRREYKGKKGVIGLVKKLFGWIKAGAQFLLKLIKKMLSLVTKTIKFIFNEIREAITAFKNGLSFLFGKRIITTQGITTDYDFDFDGVTKLTGQISSEVIQEHEEKLVVYSTSVYKALTFVRVVLKWGLEFMKGPIGWIKIAMGIAKLFKQLIVKRLKGQAIPSLAS